MFTPHTLSVALLMMITSAICWGSWANTYKGVKNTKGRPVALSNLMLDELKAHRAKQAEAESEAGEEVLPSRG